jgi:hypothetical protein
MCDSKGRWLSFMFGGLAGTMLNNQSYKKAKAKDTAAINAANQAAANQVEQNKIANSVQATDTTKETPTDLATKLKQQKVPLNTTNTGATIGTPSSVGLNLGGY